MTFEADPRILATALAMSDCVYVFDPQGRFLFANQALLDLLGLTSSGVVGKTVADLGYPPALAARILAQIGDVARTGTAVRDETPFSDAFGRERRYEYIFNPVLGAEGEVRAVAGTSRDVTEQRENAEALRITNERLRLAIEVARLGTWSWNPATDGIRADARTREICGITSENTLAGVLKCVHREDRDAVERVLRRAVGSGASGTYAADFRMVADDGSIRWVSSHGRWLVGEAGSRSGSMSGVVLDITAVKEAERALLEANRRKDEFLAMLGHELRNPLAPIASAVGLLEHLGGSPPAVEKARRVIDRQLRQLTRLVDDLLDVARISADRLVLRLEPVSLRAIFDMAVETIAPSIDPSDHRLEVDLPEDVTMLADFSRLAQVIGNLLLNAAKFTPPPGMIRLEGAVGEREIEIRVRDDGVGFDPAEKDELFRPFVQAKDRPSEGGGLGLGLALVKRLTELHGGTVEARSDGVRGAEFIVRLPLVRPQPASTGRLTDGAARPLRLLVVEDNADARETFAALLQLHGHEVRAVADGPRAYETTATFTPDAIFLDLGLPGEDGYEVCARLRMLDSCRNARFVATTGYGGAEFRERAERAGFSDYLTKPLDFDHVLRVLEERISGAG